MLEQEYHASTRRSVLVIAAGAVLTLIAAYLFTTLGMKDAALFQTVDAVTRYFDGTLDDGTDAAMNKIILLLRLPRVLLAIIAGAGLALAGALMQSVTRNYLVSPFTLGISSAAALGASLCIVLAAVIQWTFGSLHRASWEYVAIGGVIVTLGIAAALFYALPLNVMAVSDDETARSLGVNPARLRTIAGLVAVLMTATIISFTGVIGFVGLIAPHMARFLIGTDHRFYLPLTAVLGAALLLVSDTVGKLILYPVTIPVGIVISFLGVPLFIHLILRRGRSLT